MASSKNSPYVLSRRRNWNRILWGQMPILDAWLDLYERVCPSVGREVCYAFTIVPKEKNHAESKASQSTINPQFSLVVIGYCDISFLNASSHLYEDNANDSGFYL